MAEHFRFLVTIGGSELRSVSSIYISQAIFSHHEFEVNLPMATLVKVNTGDDPIPVLQKLIGADIEIELATASPEDTDGSRHSSVFKGIVTDMNVNGNKWEHSNVNLRGFSTTILMDTIPHNQGYEESTIMDIFRTCLNRHLSGKIAVNDNLTYSSDLPYTVQYEESDFDFIKRLCFEYGEWFYYDGENLCLGKDPGAATLDIGHDRLRNLRYDYSLSSSSPKVWARDYRENKMEEIIPEKVKASDVMASHNIEQSENLFTGSEQCHVNKGSFASGDNMQDEKTQLSHKLNVANKVQQANVMTVSGDCDSAKLRLGSIIRLDGMHHAGEFVVVSISHSCVDARSYSNHFKAIPKEALFPKDIYFQKPKLHSCVGVVMENCDPEKLGRVRVRFDWCDASVSPWIRIANTHAGDSRGMYFLPEIEDEVIVGFENGCLDQPYVIGSLYNGPSKYDEVYDDDNSLKSIKTRSGNQIIFDDNGKLIIRNEGNSFELQCDGNGKIELITDGDMQFTANGKVRFDAGGNFEVVTDRDFKINAGGKNQMSSRGATSIKATQNLELESTANFTAKGGQNAEIEGTMNASLSGMMVKVEGSATSELSGNGMATIKGGLVKIN